MLATDYGFDMRRLQGSAKIEGRGKEIALGAAIVFGFFGLAICLLAFWRLIPGWVGETVGIVAGVISTPFFLEASFATGGLMIVLFLNSWRRRKTGDEFVEFDVKDLPAEYRADSE